MEHDDELNSHLSQISTQWTLVFQAHGGRPEEVSAAQEALMLRYAGAIHRYLLAVVRDPDVASDLDQEFALRFLRGDFHRADPSRGRFRDFVKRAVRNLMIDYYKRGRRRAARPLDDAPEPAVAPHDIESELDHTFLESWRKELMSRAWDALARLQDESGQPYYTVLRCRVEFPQKHSPELAQILSQRLGRPVSAVAARQALHRARDRFVGFLLKEVESSLSNPTQEDIEQELIELGLMEYCRPVFQKQSGDR